MFFDGEGWVLKLIVKELRKLSQVLQTEARKESIRRLMGDFNKRLTIPLGAS